MCMTSLVARRVVLKTRCGKHICKIAAMIQCNLVQKAVGTCSRSTTPLACNHWPKLSVTYAINAYVIIHGRMGSKHVIVLH